MLTFNYYKTTWYASKITEFSIFWFRTFILEFQFTCLLECIRISVFIIIKVPSLLLCINDINDILWFVIDISQLQLLRLLRKWSNDGSKAKNISNFTYRTSIMFIMYILLWIIKKYNSIENLESEGLLRIFFY